MDKYWQIEQKNHRCFGDGSGTKRSELKTYIEFRLVQKITDKTNISNRKSHNVELVEPNALYSD